LISKQILKNYQYEIILIIISLIKLGVIALYIKVDDYGLWLKVYALSAIITFLIGGGITDAIKKNRLKNISPTVNAINLVCIVIGGLVLAIEYILVEDIYNNLIYAILAYTIGILTVAQATYGAILISQKEIDRLGKSRVVGGLATLMSTLAMIGYDAGINILIYPPIVGLIISIALMKNYSFSIKYNRRAIYLIWKHAYYLTPLSLLNYLMNNSIAIFGSHFLTNYEIGVYGFAKNIMNLIISFTYSPLYTFIYPMLRSRITEINSKISQLIDFQVTLITPLSIISIIATHYILAIFYGQKWLIGYEILIILYFTEVIKYGLVPFSSILTLKNKFLQITWMVLLRFILYLFAIAIAIATNIEINIYEIAAILVAVDILALMTYALYFQKELKIKSVYKFKILRAYAINIISYIPIMIIVIEGNDKGYLGLVTLVMAIQILLTMKNVKIKHDL